MERLTFITGNAGKAKYLSDYLHIPVDHIKLDLQEIQSLDLQEVVEDKAKRAFEIVKKPVLVEDVSLVFEAMNELPGTFIKWFLESLGNDGLCEMMDNFKKRDAYAKVMFAVYDGNKMEIFEGGVKGSIAEKPRGDAGFGWDPIFIPHGYQKTWGEMSDDEKHETSMRRIALTKMKEFII